MSRKLRIELDPSATRGRMLSLPTPVDGGTICAFSEKNSMSPAATRVLVCLLLLLVSNTAVAESMDTTFIARAFERILIVAFAGCSLFLGFRLFRITAENAGQLSAEGQGWTIRMAQVGPGVFFAFFGAAVLIFALWQAPTETIGPDERRIVRGSISIPSSATSPRDAVRAFNTLALVIDGPAAAGDKERSRAKQALSVLEPVKASLVDQVLGPNQYNEWTILNGRRTTDPSGLAQDLQNDPAKARRFNATEQLLSEVLP